MSIQQTQVFCIAPGFRLQWEKAQQAYVLLYPEGMVKLNGSAGEIMAQVDGESSVSQIIDNLERKFSTAESIANDVIDFIGQAQGNQWIRSAQ